MTGAHIAPVRSRVAGTDSKPWIAKAPHDPGGRHGAGLIFRSTSEIVETIREPAFAPIPFGFGLEERHAGVEVEHIGGSTVPRAQRRWRNAMEFQDDRTQICSGAACEWQEPIHIRES
jgi:hypothetical protein